MTPVTHTPFRRIRCSLAVTALSAFVTFANAQTQPAPAHPFYPNGAPQLDAHPQEFQPEEKKREKSLKYDFLSDSAVQMFNDLVQSFRCAHQMGFFWPKIAFLVQKTSFFAFF